MPVEQRTSRARGRVAWLVTDSAEWVTRLAGEAPYRTTNVRALEHSDVGGAAAELVIDVVGLHHREPVRRSPILPYS